MTACSSGASAQLCAPPAESMAARIRLLLGTEYGFDTAERIPADRDPVRANERLFSQPGKRRQLVVQVIGLQEPNQCGRAGSDAALLPGGVNLIADERAGGRAQPLPAAVRPEEHPSATREDGTERLECVPAEHPGSAAVVVDNSRKWSRRPPACKTPCSVTPPLANDTIPCGQKRRRQREQKQNERSARHRRQMDCGLFRRLYAEAFRSPMPRFGNQSEI